MKPSFETLRELCGFDLRHEVVNADDSYDEYVDRAGARAGRAARGR